ncbi:SusC/RagA family TonB-linked outer membrane protein [Pedobacter endophyticus]|uniref:SusC/RagA family TonB-linked outer membrane protein n=1 Tax=Pedobacter endophyticus TaxID=2789740 RepID=A0A7S9KZJ4_9SPHI|nr:SusC/RagA family TonB-linked outer membrane protein [Pedobacter endophyticus]QPH39715.1 SusC/RagA family TonB-linked outer membrane protein [Pedobacter endophyticus]
MYRFYKKLLLFMRLTTVIMLLSLLQVSANSLAQRVTLSEKGTSLSGIFEKIKSQAGIDFMVSSEIIENAKPIFIQAKNMPLNEVLTAIFKDQPLDYFIGDKYVVVSRKKESLIDNEKSEPLNVISDLVVKGKVVDDKGMPLSGAIVIVKGQRQAVRTAKDGSFTLRNVKEGSVLIIRYVGFKTKEIKSSDDVGVIRMEVAVEELAETSVTVNTGYQRIRPEQSTGATSQLNTVEYESRISTNFLDGLTNRLPGLMINNDVTFTSNTPGTRGSDSKPLFNIRGISTMSANQSPLIVIDGYPTELTLEMIDPNEIESVTILKDAAAATVYGVRASNGVIVITRKKARRGLPKFTFRSTFGMTPKENYSRYRWAKDGSALVTTYQIATTQQTVNESSWALLAKNQLGGGGETSRNAVFYILAQQAAGLITPEQAASVFAEYSNYNNIEDYSRLFLRNSMNSTYNFNVSGGSDNALYYITSNYSSNRNTQRGNDNNRFLLSGRSSLKLGKKLSLELTTDYQEQRNNGAPVPGIGTFSPYERFEDVNGKPSFLIGKSIATPLNDVLMSYGLDDYRYYPLIDMNEISDRTHTVNNRITANFKYGFGAGFNLSFGGIYESSRSKQKHHASALSSEAIQLVNDLVVRNSDGTLTYNIPKGGFLSEEQDSKKSYTARMQLNYNKVIAKDHSINAILGSEIRNLITEGSKAAYFGYNDETLLHQPINYEGINSSTVRGNLLIGLRNGLYESNFRQQYVEDRFLSAYSNIVYAYKGRYSLTGSMRIDQSNFFGTNPKYRYKPLWSVGTGWNIHRESFMKDLSWVKQLKLRMAYGFNGNVAKLSLPDVIARTWLNRNTVPRVQSLELLSYANSSLRWEQTRNFNLGLDYGVFKKVTGTIDYYLKKSTDLMGSAQIDPTIGVSPALINQATIVNKGIEFSLRADWITKDKFNWNTGIVIARNTSKVLEVFQQGNSGPQTLSSLGYVKDYPVGAMFSFNYAGLDNEGFPYVINNEGTKFRTIRAAAGNSVTQMMNSSTSGLSHYSGSSIPTINAGLSNRVDFGSFYVFAMINYYGGFKVRVPRPHIGIARPLEGAGAYWKEPGDELTTDVMGIAGYGSSNALIAYNFSDKYVVNGDYLTLADLTISYSMDKSNFIKKIGLSHFELKGQVSNIMTIGLNKENFSMATRSYQKPFLTPTYTLGLFTNF